MTTRDEHFAAVGDALARELGCQPGDITYEYPGFLMMDCGEGGVWNFGTANVTWGADFERDGVTLGGFETPYTETDDPAVIAHALALGWAYADYEDGHNPADWVETDADRAMSDEDYERAYGPQALRARKARR